MSPPSGSPLQSSHRPSESDNASFIDAAGSGNIFAVTAFLEKHSPRLVDIRDMAGNTALIQACFRGQRSVALFLLDKGADVNARNHSGNTALMAAAWNNHHEVVELLLDRQANPSLVNHARFSAFELAQMHDCTEAAMFLVSKGAGVTG